MTDSDIVKGIKRNKEVDPLPIFSLYPGLSLLRRDKMSAKGVLFYILCIYTYIYRHVNIGV